MRKLSDWPIDFRPQPSLQRNVSDISGDPDDLAPDRSPIIEHQPPADRVLIGEISARHLFVDDHYRGAGIVLREDPSFLQGNFQYLEIVGAYGARTGTWPFV